MLFLAVSAVEKLKDMPRSFWINVVIGVAALIGLIIVIKLASRINKWILFACGFLFVTVVCMQWVYERNEPEFFTPMVDKIASWEILPSKISYFETQKNDPGAPGLKKPGKLKDEPKPAPQKKPEPTPSKTKQEPKK